MFDSILNRAPVAPVRVNPDLPPKLEEIINKWLEKDRKLRYQHASEIRTDLQRLKRDTESGQPQPQSTRLAKPESRGVEDYDSRYSCPTTCAVVGIRGGKFANGCTVLWTPLV